MPIPDRWRTDNILWVDTFVLLNLAFLTLDIYLAHSVNAFRRQAEYVPVYQSVASVPVLASALLARERGWHHRWWNALGQLVGWSSIAVGLAGVVYHLDSRFFEERTLKSLTYAAPFAAPLACAGLGLLLILNRMVDARSREWAQWVLLLALGGFAGNFVLSLTDHAVNGFFRPAEWIPVVSSAFAVGFLLLPLCMRVTQWYLGLCAVVLLMQASVGVAGFFLHISADAMGPSKGLLQNIIDGAPPFAPLLFPNLVLLALVGLWALHRHVTEAP